MKKKSKIKLGVNIDHVATLRQARGGSEPNLKLAALEAVRAGADGITIHLREDRRHIQDADVAVIKRAIRVPLNLEMALEDEIIRIALKTRPAKVCIVPEKRQELTTEGGLNAVSKKKKLRRAIPKMRKKGIEVSLFIDPEPRQILAAYQVNADAIELHTGAYANAKGIRKQKELKRIRQAARLACQLGLIVNAGHGLDYQNTKWVAKIPELCELNIGHSIVSYAMKVGLADAVKEMKRLMRKAR